MRDPREGLAGFLGRLAPLGRSSRFDLRRHAALRGGAALAEAAAVAGSGPRADARRARLLRLAGRDAEAAALWEAVLRRDPGRPEALAGRWELAASAGRPDDADLDRALAAEPERAAWRAWRGLWRLWRRRDPGTDLRRAAEAGGAAGTLARLGLALAQLRAGRPERALPRLDEALKLAPKEGWLFRLRAKVRFRAGDEEGFVADCEAENLRDEGIGTLAFAFGGAEACAPPKLLRRLDAEIRRRPGRHWLHALRGDCRRAPEIDDHAGGLADLEEAARLAPRAGWILGYVARARLSVGDPEGAAAAASAATAAAPRCGWLRAWRGGLRAKAGDAAGALADFDAAAALDPDYDLVYLWRGAARRQNGLIEDALSDLDLAARLTPTRPGVWRLRERVLRELGRGAEADESARRARACGEQETEARRRLDSLSPFDAVARPEIA
jgi:tetratricopeptide (TPR) repeat protein